MRFDRPFEGVAPVPLGTAVGNAWILGHGISEARADGLLRRAPLRVSPTPSARGPSSTVRGNDGERFNAARMVCAGDVNGRRR